MKQTQNTNAILEKMAQALPYEDQAALLTIREKIEAFGYCYSKSIPSDILQTLVELTLVEGEHKVRLTSYGKLITDYCIC